MRVIEMTDAQVAEQLRLAAQNGDKQGVATWHGEIYARKRMRERSRKAGSPKPCPSANG
jgi:hypothetical protein